MSKELVISSNRHETRVAILEEDQLVEIYFQRANEYSLAGSVHKGRVTRVLPGMQSAFVDLGLERDTFLYVSDFFEDGEDYDKVTGGAEERPAARGERPERQERPSERGDGRGGDRGGRNSHRGRHERPERGPSHQQSHGSVPMEAVPPVITPEVPHFAATDAVAAEPILPHEGEEAPVATAAASAEAGGARPAPRDDRDRRGGRRGRRRRGRGHGFPESKYAPEAPAAESSAAEAEVEEKEFEESVEPVSTADVMVLPGESLAKYRQAPAREEAYEVPEFVRPLHHESEPEAAQVPNPPPIPITISNDPIEHPSANALPDAPIHPERIHEGMLADPIHASALGAAQAHSHVEEAEGIEDFEAEEPPAGIIEDEEDREIQDMIFEANDDEADAAQEAAESGLDLVAGPAADAETGQPADGGPAQAQIREGGRYMQRQSGRRMRRGRGDRGSGGGGGARGGRDDQRRGPQQQQAPPDPAGTPVAPAPAATVVPRGGAPVSITDLLKEGQEIIVQIAKEPLGQKGARITSHIALPGRYVVYMPTLDHMGVSRKIASDEERHRLKRILQNARAGITGGCIIRTAGEGKTEEELTSDINFLHNLWLDIRQKAEKRPAPLLLHHDLDIVQRILRDQFNDNFKAVWVDNEEMYESVMRFVQRFQPSLVNKIKLYTRPIPIFDAFNITAELEKALRPKIWLKSGGYIVINQTEALVAIDINTGKFVGKSNRLEDTIVKTNVEAVKEIVRQIRLRDLGGIIVIDFIDMDERKNRGRVMQALEEAMRQDRAPYKILQFNDFGLVAITRKRVKQSLERALCAPCPYCEGAGSVKSVTTVLGEILQEAQKIAAAVDGSNVMLRCNPEVAKILKSHHNQYLEELEEILKRPVLVKSDPAIHQEKFDLA